MAIQLLARFDPESSLLVSGSAEDIVIWLHEGRFPIPTKRIQLSKCLGLLCMSTGGQARLAVRQEGQLACLSLDIAEKATLRSYSLDHLIKDE
jgi:hypothetical protein